MKLLIFGGTCLLAAMFQTARVRADDHTALIEYGQSIGKVHLGVEDKEVEAVLGKPSNSVADANTEIESWQSSRADGGITLTVVTFTQDKKHHRWEAAEVFINSRYFHTKGGVSTGSLPDAMWREFPDLRYIDAGTGIRGERLELYDAREVGVAFLITRDPGLNPDGSWGRCVGILIHRAGQDAKYVPIERLVQEPKED